MAVIARTRRKYRGQARARIEACIDFLNRQLKYDAKHPSTPVFDAAGDAAVATVLTQLGNAKNATVVISG